MITQAKVNGNTQDIIITNAYEDSEFFKKIKNDFPHSVLEYLAINGYEFNKVQEYISNNNNISISYQNFKSTSEEKEFKILSKFKIEGTSLKNLKPKNSIDESIQLELSTLKLDKQIIDRANYPFYAIVTLKNNTNIKDKNNPSFCATNIEFLEAITLDMEEYKALRKNYSTQEWLNLIFNTIGYDADTLTPFEKYSFLVRLIPFCFEQYHSIELGNKETAKSYFYSVMPGIYSSSISAGDVTMASFVNNNKTNTPGILQTTNVVNFDEVTDISLKEKGIINILQSYLQDGQANRNGDTFHGQASIAFTGNITDFEKHVLNKKSLFSLFKEDIKNETIFDKLHFFSPGWKFTKINPSKYAKKDSSKIRRDYFLCVLNLMRDLYWDYSDTFKDKIKFTNTESGRDMRIEATIIGLIMLLHPDKNISDEEIEAFAYIALTGRKTLLRDLEITNEREYVNSLQVKNVKTEKEIGFEELSNFILNISETFLNSHNISLNNIDYYYLDYYKDYDITKEINKQYGFELVEPTIVIKCIDKPNLYKLAISSYGINMNIIEESEGKNKENAICRKITDNFMLIETNEIKENVKKLHFTKIDNYSNNFEQLKEKYNNQEFITEIIDILMIDQQKQSNLSNLIKTFETRIEEQNNKLLENQDIIIKLNSFSTIKDILNLVFSSSLKISNELFYLRNLLLKHQNETLNEVLTPINYFYYNLGNKIYVDYNGFYNYAYINISFANYELRGKLYLDNNYFESLSSIPVTLPSISDKEKVINNSIGNQIEYIDYILKYLQYNDLINIATLNYHRDNQEKLNTSIEKLKSNISNLKILIDNFDAIRNLLKNLNSPYNFSTAEILNYFDLLNDLSKITEKYINAYITSNNPETLPLNISDNLDQVTLNDMYFKETIFDNKFVSDLKKSLKN